MKSQNNNFQRPALVITLWSLISVAVIGGVLYHLTPLVKGQEVGLGLSRYQSAISKVQSLITALPQEIFSHPLLGQLKQPIPMPFEVGAVGNPNPFQLPEPPEILLRPR